MNNQPNELNGENMPHEQEPNGDVVRFQRTVYGTLVVIMVTFICTFVTWFQNPEVVFAVPAFPARNYAQTATPIADANATPVPADICEALTDKSPFRQIFSSLEAARRDCRYNRALNRAYSALGITMLRYAEESGATEEVIAEVAESATEETTQTDVPATATRTATETIKEPVPIGDNEPECHYLMVPATREATPTVIASNQPTVTPSTTPTNVDTLICLRIINGHSWLPDWEEMRLSVESMVKLLAVITTFFGTLLFSVWYGTAMHKADRILYTKRRPLLITAVLIIAVTGIVMFLVMDILHFIDKGSVPTWVGYAAIVLVVFIGVTGFLDIKYPKYLTSLLMALVLAVLMYLTVDFAWFVFERIVPMPLNYPWGTSVFFAVLVLAVLSFFLIHWANEPGVTQLSILAIMVMMLGIIAGIMVTNHIWDTGVTNAFSTMSQRAYPERLAFEIAGELGSRRIFRLTFIASGLLLIVYSAHLSLLVTNIKEVLAQLAPVNSSGNLVQPGAENPQKQVSPKDILYPVVVGLLGCVAGVLTMFVGIFPTDGTATLSDEVSSGLHGFGAFGSPLVFLFMMMTFWFIGHPYDGRYVPSMRRLSWVGVTVSGMTILTHILDFPPVDFMSPAVSGLVFTLGLFAMLLLANSMQKNVELQLLFWFPQLERLAHPFVQWPIIVVGGLLLLLLPPLINTVALEFIVLTLFAWFIYAYSLYTKEYMDENGNSQQPQQPKP
jgi:hypothetical protein